MTDKIVLCQSFLEGFPSVPGSKVAIWGMIIPPSIGNPYHGSINPCDYWVDDTNIIKYLFFNSYSTKPPRSRTPKGCGYYTLQTGSYLQFLGSSAMHREGYLVGCIDRQEKMKGHTIRSHRISRSKMSSKPK